MGSSSAVRRRGMHQRHLRWPITTTVPFDWQVHTTYLIDVAVEPHRTLLYVDGVLLAHIHGRCQEALRNACAHEPAASHPSGIQLTTSAASII